MVRKVVNSIISPLSELLFSKGYKIKHNGHIAEHQHKTNKYLYDKVSGHHVVQAHYLYGYFYSGYSIFISFLLAGVILRIWGYLNFFVEVVILTVPIGVCYIPAYKAVFTKDRYLKYFKRFEKEDEQWRRKWKCITFAFCMGSVIVTILGIYAAFAIATKK